MQTISANLTAAFATLYARHHARVTIVHERPRWTRIHYATPATHAPLAACANAATIHRARVDASGYVHYHRATTPTVEADWSTGWTQLSTDSCVSSPIAIAADADGLHLRIIYTNASYVRVTESADNGATWSAPANVVAYTAPIWLAANRQAIYLFTSAGLVQYRRAWAGGAWAGPSTIIAGTLTLPYGLAVATLDATTDLLAYAAGLSLWSANATTAGVGTAGRRLAPGADQTLPSDANPRYPSLTPTRTGWMLSYRAYYPATTAVYYHNLLSSLDGTHWGLAHSLPTGSDEPLALAYAPTTKNAYATHYGIAFETYTPNVADAAQVFGPVDVPFYKRTTKAHAPGTLTVEIPDTTETLANLGEGSARPIHPMATIYLVRGAYTTAGLETVPLHPHYITSLDYTIQARRGLLRIEATDAWGLAERYASPEPLQFTNRTIAWLLAEMWGLVGILTAHDGAAIFTQTLATYTVYANAPIALALRELLALSDALCYIDPDGTAQLMERATHTPDVPTVAPVLHGTYHLALPPHTAAIAANVLYGGFSINSDIEAEIGQRYTHTQYVASLSSGAVAANFADALTARAAAHYRRAILHTPPRPECDIWDEPSISVPGLPAAITLCIVAIEEHADMQRAIRKQITSTTDPL